MENRPDLGVISWYPATGMFQKVVKSESYYPHPPYLKNVKIISTFIFTWV